MTLDDLPEAAVPLNNVAVQVLTPDLPIMGVEVFGQDVPFGGVQVIQPDDTIQIDFGDGSHGGSVGNLVTSVFTRIGDVVALRSDYAAFYQPLDKDLTQIALHGLPWKNVVDYGAKADDATDCTAAFNAAIQDAGPDGSVYVPAGVYRILGQIEMNGQGTSVPGWGMGWPSVLFGDGRLLSMLHIPASAATNPAITHGTIRAAVGATITDLGFAFDQPDPGDPPDYSVFHHYKPAIKIDLSFRIPLDTGYVAGYLGSRCLRLRIMRAWDGIEVFSDLGASPGRDIFEDIEMSMFNYGFNLDGYADETRFDKIHIFSFGFGIADNNPYKPSVNANQIKAFHLQDHAVGLYVGKHPGIRMIESLFICGTSVLTHPCALEPWVGEGCNLHFTNVQFDSFCVLKLGVDLPTTSGSANFVGCAFGADPDVIGPFIKIYRGPMRFVNCAFGFLNVGGSRGVLIENDSVDPVTISNCRFPLVHLDQTAITSQGGGTILISNCSFTRDLEKVYTLPVINVVSGKAIVIGNYYQETTTGSGVFLNLATDDYHIVAGNNALGWDMDWPSTSTKIQAFGNQTGALIGSNGQNQALGVKQLYLEGGSTGNLRFLSGSGSPEGVVTADPGSLYLDTSITSSGNYAKKTGTGNTGWSAMGSAVGGGGDLNYVFTQVAPSTSWAVAHNLGKFPSVSVVDSGGTEIIPNILYIDTNHVTVSFGSATSGKAYIN